MHRDFPGSPVVKTLPPDAEVGVSISGQELRSHVPCGKKKKKKKTETRSNIVTNSIKILKIVHIKKQTNAHTLML